MGNLNIQNGILNCQLGRLLFSNVVSQPVSIKITCRLGVPLYILPLRNSYPIFIWEILLIAQPIYQTYRQTTTTTKQVSVIYAFIHAWYMS